MVGGSHEQPRIFEKTDERQIEDDAEGREIPAPAIEPHDQRAQDEVHDHGGEKEAEIEEACCGIKNQRCDKQNADRVLAAAPSTGRKEADQRERQKNQKKKRRIKKHPRLPTGGFFFTDGIESFCVRFHDRVIEVADKLG